MNYNEEELLEWLIESQDSTLDEARAIILKRALQRSDSLQNKAEALGMLRHTLRTIGMESNNSFSGKVMQAIQTKVTSFGLNALFPKVAAACLLILISIGLYLYQNNGGVNVDVLVGSTNVSPDMAYSFLISENAN